MEFYQFYIFRDGPQSSAGCTELRLNIEHNKQYVTYFNLFPPAMFLH